MAKVTVTELANLQSETSAVQVINQNFQALVDAIENTFSRDGTTPNSLASSLDMNSNRILNLPEPVNDTDAVRLVDIGGITGLDMDEIRDLADQVAEDAAEAAQSAEDAANYVGAAAQAPKWTTGRTITYSGSDISGTSPAWDGSANLTWSGVTISTGAVTAAKLASGAAVGNIGYTPANKAGDTFTGDVRLSFTATTLNVDSVGFRGVPVNTQDLAYTLLVNDCGRMVRHTSATPHVYTIESTGTVVYPVGATIVVRNVGAGAITLNRAIGVTLRKAGSATDANVTVAQWGLCTLIHEATNVWVAVGTGIS